MRNKRLQIYRILHGIAYLNINLRANKARGVGNQSNLSFITATALVKTAGNRFFLILFWQESGSRGCLFFDENKI